jgi:Protein of unknown function DUF2625
MKSLGQLIERDDPAFPLIKEWASAASNDCMLLPPSANRGEILLAMQVTTRLLTAMIATTSISGRKNPALLSCFADGMVTHR